MATAGIWSPNASSTCASLRRDRTGKGDSGPVALRNPSRPSRSRTPPAYAFVNPEVRPGRQGSPAPCRRPRGRRGTGPRSGCAPRWRGSRPLKCAGRSAGSSAQRGPYATVCREAPGVILAARSQLGPLGSDSAETEVFPSGRVAAYLMDVAHEGQSLAAALNHWTPNMANCPGGVPGQRRPAGGLPLRVALASGCVACPRGSGHCRDLGARQPTPERRCLG